MRMSQNAFSLQFVPVVRKGENLELIKNDTDILGYFRVLYIEQLPQVDSDFGSINKESSTGDTEITNLYMPDGELAQYHCICLDDLELTISQPKAKKRFAAKNVVHALTALAQQVAPNLSAFFVWEDEKVYFDAKNPTKYNRKRNRVRFIGFRFILEKLTVKPGVFTTIPIEGA